MPATWQRDNAIALPRHGHEAQRHAFGAEILGLVGFGRLLNPFALLGALFFVEAHDNVKRAVLKVGEWVTRS